MTLGATSQTRDHGSTFLAQEVPTSILESLTRNRFPKSAKRHGLLNTPDLDIATAARRLLGQECQCRARVVEVAAASELFLASCQRNRLDPNCDLNNLNDLNDPKDHQLSM
jgi:hypothetical protein